VTQNNVKPTEFISNLRVASNCILLLAFQLPFFCAMRFFGYVFFQIFCCGFSLLDADEVLDMNVAQENPEEEGPQPDFCPYGSQMVSYRFEYYWQVERGLNDYAGDADPSEEARVRDAIRDLRQDRDFVLQMNAMDGQRRNSIYNPNGQLYMRRGSSMRAHNQREFEMNDLMPNSQLDQVQPNPPPN
jgi:hypothetical protein